MIRRILRIIIELKSRVVAFLLCVIAYPLIIYPSLTFLSKRIKKIGAEDNIKQNYARMLKLIVKRGRNGILFHRHSLPVSSKCNTWPESIYDALYRTEWVVGKEKDFSQISFKEKLIYFTANIAKKSGLFPFSWSLLEMLTEKENSTTKFLGYLGQLDILLLFNGWTDQLDNYSAKKIWFNLQEIEGFHDELSWFFNHCEQLEIDEIYTQLKELRPVSSVVQELLAEHFERKGELNKALRHYRLACAFNPGNGSAMMRLKNIELLSGDEQIAKIAPAKDICQEIGWDYEEYGDNQRLKVKYTVVLNNVEIFRSIDMDFAPPALAELKNIQNLGGGLVETGDGKSKNYVVLDSKHLDLTHLKLFSPRVIVHDREKALLIDKPDTEVNIWKKVFLIPGLGWNYYHWLFEIVPLLKIYEDSGLKGEYPLSFQFQLKKWHMETLDLLGYSEVDIIPFFPDSVDMYEDVRMPVISSHDLVASAGSISFIRGSLSQHREIKSGKNIYLTRKDVDAVRKSSGNKQLEERLKERNFEFVDPSRMSLKKQIEFFSDVDTIIAQAGAALANLAFCPKGTKVVVIAAERAWSESFTSIAAVAEVDLRVILCKCTPYPNPYYLWTAFDFEINCDEIISYIDNLL